MAFVSKSPRKVFEARKEELRVVPQSIEVARRAAKRSSNHSPNPAPFNSTVPRRQERKDTKPGPGAYNLERSLIKETVLDESYDSGVKVLEESKPTTPFRSGTRRFGNDATLTPGPGA